MTLLIIVRLIIVLIVGYIFISQILIPLLIGSKLFPMFRKEAKLKSQISDTRQQIIEKDLKKQITKMKKKEGLE